jgi:hypothetical protein
VPPRRHGWREAPRSMSARPLTRETSACTGWRLPPDGPQGSQGGRNVEQPGFVVGMADGASTPSGRSPPSPAQAGRAVPLRSNRGSGGRVVVLVDCSGCRSRREASGPAASLRSGLATQPRARVVKGRRKPARGGKAVGTVASSRRSRDLGPHGSGDRAEKARPERVGPAAQAVGRARAGAGERALVEGRRPGSEEASTFDEALGEAGLAALPGGIRSKDRSAPGGAATEDVRGHATGSARGGECRCRVTPRGGALDRGSARTAWYRGSVGARGQNPGDGHAGWGEAEAGGSPSSEAPPGDPPEVFDGRWIGAVGATPAREWVRLGARESGSP